MPQVLKATSSQVTSCSQALWNSKSLDAPPLVTFQYTESECAQLSCFKSMFADHLARFLDLANTTRDQYSTELTLLGKLIYKNWNCFRKEKSIQYMRKLRNLAKGYSALDLPSLVTDLMTTTTTAAAAGQAPRMASREYYEYFLVRLLGAHSLLVYAMDLVKFKVSVHLMKAISNAIYLANNLLFISVSARIY